MPYRLFSLAIVVCCFCLMGSLPCRAELEPMAYVYQGNLDQKRVQRELTPLEVLELARSFRAQGVLIYYVQAMEVMDRQVREADYRQYIPEFLVELDDFQQEQARKAERSLAEMRGVLAAHDLDGLGGKLDGLRELKSLVSQVKSEQAAWIDRGVTSVVQWQRLDGVMVDQEAWRWVGRKSEVNRVLADILENRGRVAASQDPEEARAYFQAIQQAVSELNPLDTALNDWQRFLLQQDLDDLQTRTDVFLDQTRGLRAQCAQLQRLADAGPGQDLKALSAAREELGLDRDSLVEYERIIQDMLSAHAWADRMLGTPDQGGQWRGSLAEQAKAVVADAESGLRGLDQVLSGGGLSQELEAVLSLGDGNAEQDIASLRGQVQSRMDAVVDLGRALAQARSDMAEARQSLDELEATAQRQPEPAQQPLPAGSDNLTVHGPASLGQGQSARYAGLDAAGKRLSGVRWFSSDAQVLTIRESGLATAQAPGTAVVMAWLGGEKSYFQVTVTAEPQDLSATPPAPDFDFTPAPNGVPDAPPDDRPDGPGDDQTGSGIADADTGGGGAGGAMNDRDNGQEPDQDGDQDSVRDGDQDADQDGDQNGDQAGGPSSGSSPAPSTPSGQGWAFNNPPLLATALGTTSTGYHIYAAGIRLGCASGLARYSTGQADQDILTHLGSAGDHVYAAWENSREPLLAWRNHAAIRSDLNQRGQRLLDEGPESAYREQLANGLKAKMNGLAQAVAIQYLGDHVEHMENCESNYHRLGFYLGYAQQVYLVAVALAQGGADPDLVKEAVADANQALRAARNSLFSLEKVVVVSGACADLRDLRGMIAKVLVLKDPAAQVEQTGVIWRTAGQRIQAMAGGGAGSANNGGRQDPDAPSQPSGQNAGGSTDLAGVWRATTIEGSLICTKTGGKTYSCVDDKGEDRIAFTRTSAGVYMAHYLDRSVDSDGDVHETGLDVRITVQGDDAVMSMRFVGDEDWGDLPLVRVE